MRNSFLRRSPSPAPRREEVGDIKFGSRIPHGPLVSFGGTLVRWVYINVGYEQLVNQICDNIGLGQSEFEITRAFMQHRPA